MNIVTLFLALAILAGIILLCLSDRKKVKQFDERQLIVRSRAVNLAYVTLLICLFIVLILSTMSLPWLDVPVCVILSMFVSLTVFSVYAILNNAYFTGVKKESPFRSAVKALVRFRIRSSGVSAFWASVFRVRERNSGRTGIPRYGESSRARSSAWLNPLVLSREGCTGTGIIQSAPSLLSSFP